MDASSTGEGASAATVEEAAATAEGTASSTVASSTADKQKSHGTLFSAVEKARVDDSSTAGRHAGLVGLSLGGLTNPRK